MGSMLNRASKQLPEGSPVRQELREVSEIAQSALDNVRGLSQSLHPSILEELGLESTMNWYLSTFEKQFGIEVSYERHGDPVVVDEQIGIHVYRVLQEALANVARHSGAKRASVRLRSSNDLLELEVEDHGAGFKAERSQRGLGLIAMRERAALLRGSLEVTRPPQGGTLVRLRVPLPQTAPVV
jgi:two-component system sensor histidine kinase UhpB